MTRGRVITMLFMAIFALAFKTIPEQSIPKLSWDVMQDIEFKEEYVEEMEGYMLFPKFTKPLLNLNGKVVEVEGYVIPVDKDGVYVALSANPYASCFFCGQAGPASVMTIRLKKKDPKYNIDDYRKFKGKLRLNSENIHEFYYILEESVDITK